MPANQTTHQLTNHPTSHPTWTNERLELLKSGFEAGLSCREIAAHIGVSRNAVIGKISRMNLTRDKAGVRRPAAKKPAEGGAAGRSARQGRRISASAATRRSRGCPIVRVTAASPTGCPRIPERDNRRCALTSCLEHEMRFSSRVLVSIPAASRPLRRSSDKIPDRRRAPASRARAHRACARRRRPGCAIARP